MTTEEAKALAIRKAYGDLYLQILECMSVKQWAVDAFEGEGRIYKNFLTSEISSKIDWSVMEDQQGEVWHESLSGIEDNNGWIRIEPDGSNLPEQKEWMYQVISKKAGYCLAPFVNGTPLSTPEYWLKHFTHWKPIEKSEPIY